ncbi:MAG: hypothetical protein KGY54_13785 [Oleiphilaceae bacterium]|nr:hypothetical protein [Oleiphilaceae bacterium]
MKNIFVVGMDSFNHELLKTLNDGEQYRFISLFDYEEVVNPPGFSYPSMNDLVDRARATFKLFDGTVDGIIGFWDFPTSALVPMIARDAGLAAPTLEAVARCEHKYYARLEQTKAVPDMVPRFQVINPFDEDPAEAVTLDYPFWVKPIKAHSSFLGFHVDGPETLRQCMATTREQISKLGEPFNEFLARVELPPEVEGIDGYHCIAEEIISAGFQCTLEGYCWENQVKVFGVVDSIKSKEKESTFSRYQYPSKLPSEVQARMVVATRELMRQIEYDGGAFNIEFFWNPDTDHIYLLEVNSRVSKSHSPLFLMVDGATNLKVPLDLALGRRPEFPSREGVHPLAGKFMLRYFEDGIIERLPDDNDLARLRELDPEARVVLEASEGMQLSELKLQDSYSYEVAAIFLGAESQKALLDKFEKAKEILGFKIRPLEGETAV